MRLSHWLALIGLMAGLGIAKVSQQTATWLNAYALGQRHADLHELENDTAWLKTKLVGLQSPARLLAVMEEQRLQLVAWSELRNFASQNFLLDSLRNE